MRTLLFAGVVATAACSFEPGRYGSVATGDAGRTIDGAGPLVDGDIDPPMADAMLDGPPLPAPYDPSMCPADYTLTAAIAPDSRYRLIATNATLKAHHLDCADDRTGWTHLVAYDSTTETNQVGTFTTSDFYIGIVQPRDQVSPNAGWLSFTGEASITGIWQTSQPNDNAGIENNEQNFAAVDDSATVALNDVSGGGLYFGVCECDGKPIPTAVTTAIDASAP